MHSVMLNRIGFIFQNFCLTQFLLIVFIISLFLEGIYDSNNCTQTTHGLALLCTKIDDHSEITFLSLLQIFQLCASTHCCFQAFNYRMYDKTVHIANMGVVNFQLLNLVTVIKMASSMTLRRVVS
jgi:hypothetical protein